MASFFRYKTAIFRDQSRVDGDPFDYDAHPPIGQSWSWSGDLTAFTVREETEGATRFDGDSTGRPEVIQQSSRLGRPNEQTVEIDGTPRQVLWDYNVAVYDRETGEEYIIGVIDVDLDNDNTVQDPGEDGYYIIFVGDVPPKDIDLEIVEIFDNPGVRTHEQLSGNAVCFAAGTLILTKDGSVPIENLKLGAAIITRDESYQSLRWIGRSTVDASGHCAPVVITKGALGNERDLLVSPQHRMLVGDWYSELLFGHSKVLVRAIDLVNGTSIYQQPRKRIEYFHLLFDEHQIIYAEGIATESMYPGPVAMATLSDENQREILDVFPKVVSGGPIPGNMAMRPLRRHEANCWRKQ